MSIFMEPAEPKSHGEWEGQAVVVTGGSRGIGRAVVEHFARQRARVFLTYHQNAEAARLARRPGARSGTPMLRKLARCDMVLATDGTSADDFRDTDIKALGLAVTRMIERRYDGDRARALPPEPGKCCRRGVEKGHGKLRPSFVRHGRAPGSGRRPSRV